VAVAAPIPPPPKGANTSDGGTASFRAFALFAFFAAAPTGLNTKGSCLYSGVGSTSAADAGADEDADDDDDDDFDVDDDDDDDDDGDGNVGDEATIGAPATASKGAVSSVCGVLRSAIFKI